MNSDASFWLYQAICAQVQSCLTGLEFTFAEKYGLNDEVVLEPMLVRLDSLCSSTTSPSLQPLCSWVGVVYPPAGPPYARGWGLYIPLQGLI